MRLLFGVKAIRTHLARTYSSSRFGKVSKQTGTKCAKTFCKKENSNKGSKNRAYRICIMLQDRAIFHFCFVLFVAMHG